MAIVSMSKLNLVAMSYDKSAILNALQRTGATEVKLHYEAENTVPLSADCEQLRAYLGALEAVLSCLSREAEEYNKANKIKTDALADGKAATARLDAAKVMLAAKRGVIDEVYARALEKLKALPQKEAVRLAEGLLLSYAEDGDELVFATNFAYKAQVLKLAVVAEKNLKNSGKTADIDGGFILIGKNSDKDLSYGALLALDREERQAEIAAKLFSDGVSNA